MVTTYIRSPTSVCVTLNIGDGENTYRGLRRGWVLSAEYECETRKILL